MIALPMVWEVLARLRVCKCGRCEREDTFGSKVSHKPVGGEGGGILRRYSSRVDTMTMRQNLPLYIHAIPMYIHTPVR